MLEIISIISFLTWIYIIFFYSNRNFSYKNLFWSNKIVFENEKAQELTKKIKLCIIIPARNEEKNITKTLTSINSQKFKNLSILVVDDNSTDQTMKKINDFSKKQKTVNFFIISGKTLPNGWSGKVWALKQAIDFLKGKNFSHYLFLDSDIRLKKNILNQTIAYLSNNELVMVSLMAKLNCVTFWEKLLIPSFIYFFQKIYPFSKVNNPKNALAAAAGGFVLCKAKLFDNKNLFEVIKNKVIDDCNLARLAKKKGNIWLGLSEQVYSHRNYDKLSEIWTMVSRTAYEQLNFSIINLSLSILGMIILYILPIFGIIYYFLGENYFLFIINFLSFILMTISLVPTILFYRLHFVYFFSLPFSGLIYIMMTITSALNYYFRKGNLWKGRKY